MKELKYKKMYDTILALIQEGFWAPDDKIYSERHFAEEYQVSRLTVRRAIADLLADGYLEYREGRQGAFVPNRENKPVSSNPEKATDKLIGVAVDNHTPEFASQLLQGIHDSLWDEGYHTIYCNTYRESHDIFLKIRTLVLDESVQGFILSPLIGKEYEETNREILDFLDEHKVPFVLVDRFIRYELHNHVVINNRECFRELTRRLIEQGHSRILLPYGFEATSTEDRIAGVHDAFREAGLEESGILRLYCDEQEYEADYEIPESVMKQLEDLGEFTAVIGMNSLFTRLGRAVAKQLGIQPQIGTISISNHTKKDDIVIRHPVYDLGKQSGILLSRLIAERPLPVVHLILKAEVL